MVEELYTPEQLNQMHQQLWQCVLEFANVSAAQERHRIARELHDSLGHALTALNFQLQTASKLCKPDPNQAQEFLNEANRLMAIATQEVRQSVKALRNDPLATQSLETLIASLVSDFHQTTGILPEVEINLPMTLLPHFTAPLYRIIQEALNNIRKYAQATAVQIHLCTTSTGLHLTIQDNGRGFDIENISGGYGLRGMQERIAVLQGQFQLTTQPQAGCCIHVEIPLQISNLLEIPTIPEIANISIISEISIPQESVSLSHNQSVRIGEWQPLNLDEWQNSASQEFMF
ncbi:integral membrane sensor signal transduction histidine kinase [Calothrix sp. NIES-2100]|uniref:sensor histidine kinase n=1 Tax=Calothrix sp. NIES-2100 TaxID=1954172 RepID=UPI000B616A9F|nr:integral membrane sensor signal transduction histidine kinase [Calothrix sp. NIES-2100]